jgi:very-short-patch-repair endonuclease
MVETEILNILDECDSINEICLKLYSYCNGRTIKKIKSIILEYGYENKFLLNSKEKYYKNPKLCLECGNIINYNPGNIKNFCNSSCSATYNNKKRGKHTEETKIKISKSLKQSVKSKKPKEENTDRIHSSIFCDVCNKELTLKQKNRGNTHCSPKCSKSDPKVKKKISDKNGTHQGWKSRNIKSYPEIFFSRVLSENLIEFEFNKMIKKRDLGINCDSNYFLDFYFDKNKIDLEIDGGQHKYRKDHDRIRDELLIKNGYTVYRIEWKSINSENGKKYIKNEINKFLIFYQNKIKSINENSQI